MHPRQTPLSGNLHSPQGDGQSTDRLCHTVVSATKKIRQGDVTGSLWVGTESLLKSVWTRKASLRSWHLRCDQKNEKKLPRKDLESKCSVYS